MDTGKDTVDAELGGNGLSNRLGVSGDHHDLRTDGMKRIDGLARLRADLVGQPQCTHNGSVDEHMEDDGAFSAPGLRGLRLGDIIRLKQPGSADLDRLARDNGSDTDRR